MRTFTDGNLTAIAPDFGAWLQQKNVLRVHVDGGSGSTVVLRKDDDNLATYTLDINGNVVIDVSDVLRVSALPCSIYITSAAGRTTGAIPFMRAGLINPLNVLIPESVSGLRMQTPSMIYEPIATGLFATEFLSLSENVGIFQYLQETPTHLEAGDLLSYSPDSNTFAGITIAKLLQERAIHAGAYTFVFDGIEEGADAPYRWTHTGMLYVFTRVRNPKNGIDETYREPDAQDVYDVCNGEYWETDVLQNVLLRKMECGKTYAAVRWVSFTGNTRIHTFEVSKPKTATRDALELLTIDGSYNVIKGREDGFALRLDGLNAFDVWYYSDIITSGRVEVSFDGLEWQQVEVVTKDITLPDGNAGKLNILEINCNWRRYDAITL